MPEENAEEPVEDCNGEEKEEKPKLTWKERILEWLRLEKVELQGDLVDHFCDGSQLVDLLRKIKVPDVRLDTREMVCYKFFLIAQRMMHNVGLRLTLTDTKAIMNRKEAVLMKILIRIYHHACPAEFADLDEGEKAELLGKLDERRESKKRRQEALRDTMTLDVSQSLMRFDTILEKQQESNENPDETEEPISKEATKQHKATLDTHLPSKNLGETQPLPAEVTRKSKRKRVRKKRKLATRDVEVEEAPVVDIAAIVQCAQEKSAEHQEKNLELWRKSVLSELEACNQRAIQANNHADSREKFFKTMELDRKALLEKVSEDADSASDAVEQEEAVSEVKAESEPCPKAVFSEEVETEASNYMRNSGDWCWDFVNDFRPLKPILDPVLCFASRLSPLPPAQKLEKPLEIALIGHALSGRQTQATCLASKWELPVISVQSLIDRAVQSFETKEEDAEMSSEMLIGEKLKAYWEETPNEIPDEIYVQALTDFVTLARKDADYSGFITHDFPRNANEAALADKALGSKKRKCAFDKVFYMEGTGFSESRSSGVIVDKETNYRYNLQFNRPVELEVESRLLIVDKSDLINLELSDETLAEVVAHFGENIKKLDASNSVESIHLEILAELPPLQEVEPTEDMVRHSRCQSFQQKFHKLRLEYETKLKQKLNPMIEANNCILKQVEDIIKSLPTKLAVEAKEKDEVILELQVNWNELSAEEKCSEAYTELVDSKLRALDRYIWQLLMREIQDGEEEMQNLYKLEIDSQISAIESALRDIASLELGLCSAMKEMMTNIAKIEHGEDPVEAILQSQEISASLKEVADSASSETDVELIFKNRLLTLNGYLEKRERAFQSIEMELKSNCETAFKNIVRDSEMKYRKVIEDFENSVKLSVPFNYECGN